MAAEASVQSRRSLHSMQEVTRAFPNCSSNNLLYHQGQFDAKGNLTDLEKRAAVIQSVQTAVSLRRQTMVRLSNSVDILCMKAQSCESDREYQDVCFSLVFSVAASKAFRV